MKQLVPALIVVALFSFAAAECNAQLGLFRRSNRVRYVQPKPRYNGAKIARPATGYGSNLHRNYVIRQEQQRASITGVRPVPRGNILWAR